MWSERGKDAVRHAIDTAAIPAPPLLSSSADGANHLKQEESDLPAQDEIAKGNPWPEPKPIQGALLPVPAFDPETLLPEVLRAWITDEADRMPCPPDFIAAAALVALASIVGARCAIKPKSQDSWLVVPNLWGGIVGLPSAKKSPAISTALKPLGRLIEKAMAAYRASMEGFEAEGRCLKLRKMLLKRASRGQRKRKTARTRISAILREICKALDNRHSKCQPCGAINPTTRLWRNWASSCEKTLPAIDN